MLTQNDVRDKFHNIRGGVKKFFHKVQTKFDKSSTDQADGVIDADGPALTDATVAGHNLVWEDDDETSSGQARRYS